MKTYPIPIDVLQEVVSILETLPYGRVASVMGRLTQIINAAQMGLPDGSNGKEKAGEAFNG